MSDNIAQRYGFSYTNDDGKVIKTTVETPGVTWMECLNDYVRFLEQIYHYPIMHKVLIEEPKYNSFMLEEYPDYSDPWTGEYFTKEEDENSSNS